MLSKSIMSDILLSVTDIAFSKAIFLMILLHSKYLDFASLSFGLAFVTYKVFS